MMMIMITEVGHGLDQIGRKRKYNTNGSNFKP